MKLSIEGFSFHGMLRDGTMDIYHYLESLKYRYGVDGAGIWNGFMTSTDSDYLTKLKHAIEEKEMVIPNIAVDGASVCVDDKEQQEKFHQNALAHIRAAAYLGAQSVRIDWGVREPDLTEEQFDLLVNRYREYCEIAWDEGMYLGPENHFGASLNPHLQAKVLEAINHPGYRILLHLGHWSVDEEQGDAMVAAHAMHTHIPQNIAESNLEERLQVLVDAGYEGYWGIEHHTAQDEYVMVEWQLARVKRALTKVLNA